MQIFKFYEGQLMQQICYSFILLISIYQKWQSSSFSLSIFPNYDGPNAFSPNSTGPWSQLQNGRKIPEKCIIIQIGKQFVLEMKM